ncbi:MAG: FAD-dependent oxidoreductase [Methylobacterium sp.]|nr:FAD-dependent oxidoreductase [Methylobacterium sp.]MCA3634219.1 FAD-dependent oxidoreductase [Methylobacterium sp.]MCA3638421.1 FAD-dependent oxidoreductase [Methylobacterium sp.]MCA3646147.1 FAD-dependent oxidoreductase [Methylobacterium sp.]MCA3651622.1 FAD-dependent oxidoreductase [Methylobacterium sp.]
MSRQLVLVGGGHAHVQVIRALAEHPEPDLAVTLVTDRLLTPYSGMLPGHIAGFYSHSEMHIDLGRLARVAGVSLVDSAANGIDRVNRHVRTKDGSLIPYDILSLNIGITPDLSGITGAGQHGIAVKPISTFLERLDALLADAARPDGPRRIVLVGGGAAGIELALALKARLGNLETAGRPFWIAIATGNGLVPTLNLGVRRHVRHALARHGVTVLDSFRVVEITADGIRAEDGRSVEAEAVLLSTAAKAPEWLGETGLATTTGGFLSITPTLASIGDPAIFAVGDCATMISDPIPKAGVFAVRQGAALTGNIRRALRGEPLKPHGPDPDFLTILMTGDGSAIAGRGAWLAVEGRWVWRWKDWIDRRFMRRFSDFRL